METKVKRLSHQKKETASGGFILNKLARPALLMSKMRKSVLVRQAGKLDNEYLTKRAQQAEVLAILQTIQSS